MIDTTIDAPDGFVEKARLIYLLDDNAVSCMCNFFISFHALLSKRWVSWANQKHPEISVPHITHTVRPKALQSTLLSEISFCVKHLKNDLKEFIQQCLKLSEALQLLNVSPMPNNLVGRIRQLKENNSDRTYVDFF